MKRYILVLLVAMFGFNSNPYAQGGQNNIWTFGHGYSLDFNYSPPLLKDTVYYNGQPNRTTNPNNVFFNYHRSSAVCDAGGNLLFSIKCIDAVSDPNAPNIFDRNENPIAGTGFLYDPVDGAYNKIPSIVPHPGNPDQYYIFYTRNKGLLYSLFDLSLNGGLGSIVPGQHNILLSNYNSVIGARMTTVQGCNGIWLIIRHHTDNKYLSYKIDAAGLLPVPVVSEVGLMPIGAYSTQVELIASSDGKIIATAFPKIDHLNQPGGIEMYSFEKCSGKLKNARIFDVGNNNYGVAFSPDDSKLYVECNLPRIQPNQPLSQTEQNLYQFDLSLPDLTAIETSKTLILSNPTVQRLDPFCPQNIGALGSMRIGRDGRLYMTNGQPQVCPGTSGVGLALHVINDPNLPGLASNPNLNAIYNFQNGMSETYGRTNLPREIVLPPVPTLDTVITPLAERNPCYKAHDTLNAQDNATCIEWNTGATGSSIVVSESGKYWVRYVKDCKVYMDTFSVTFFKLPNIAAVQYGCQGYITFKAGESDGIAFSLELYNAAGGKIYGGREQSLHEVYNMKEGMYRLEIQGGKDCDTMLTVELKAYPAAEISIDPAIAEIKYGEELHLTAMGGSNYIWTPASSLNTRTEHTVIARPEEDTRYTVTGINEYGCRDTAYAEVKVRHPKNVVLPNAFSPNSDGLNDLFRIPGTGYAIRRFEVYNRYGQAVYLDNGTNTGWDGNYLGKACDVGVYHYFIQLDFPDRTHITLKGDVSLIRYGHALKRSPSGNKNDLSYATIDLHNSVFVGEGDRNIVRPPSILHL